MNIDMEWALDALTEDGDVFRLDNSHELRLVVEHDDQATINDYDCYGMVSWVDSYRNAREARPAGFTGAARKLQVGRGDWVWWQPPADMTSAKRWGGDPDGYVAAFYALKEHVTELVEFGFSVIGVQLHELVLDSRGHEHWVLVDADYLGAVDSTKPEHIRDYLADMISNLLTSNGTGPEA